MCQLRESPPGPTQLLTNRHQSTGQPCQTAGRTRSVTFCRHRKHPAHRFLDPTHHPSHPPPAPPQPGAEPTSRPSPAVLRVEPAPTTAPRRRARSGRSPGEAADGGGHPPAENRAAPHRHAPSRRDVAVMRAAAALEQQPADELVDVSPAAACRRGDHRTEGRRGDGRARGQPHLTGARHCRECGRDERPRSPTVLTARQRRVRSHTAYRRPGTLRHRPGKVVGDNPVDDQRGGRKWSCMPLLRGRRVLTEND